MPDTEALSGLLVQLSVAPEDAVEVLRTMPSPAHDPERWWLLERSRELLARGLANRDDNAEPLPSLPGSLALFPVHLILLTLDAIRGCHREFGIPDDISWETLSFVGRAMIAYRMSHHEAGINMTRWDWLRFLGRLYEVGRLEVIPYRIRTHPKEAGPLFWYDEVASDQLGSGFRKGDPALSLHVPATDSLTPEACDASLRRMRMAFNGVYPGEPPRIATCTSWLLDDQLAEYLPADSNIMGFQRRFELVPGASDADEAILHFVFGAKRAQDLAELPQRTKLERCVVRHLQRGHHWRMRTGWLQIVK
jgi:GNAT-like C-terminal domain/N-acyltransferase N-terminal domain